MTITTFQQVATLIQFAVAITFTLRGNLKLSVGFFVFGIVLLITTTSPQMWAPCR